jgi:Family of unknown function (DUF6627)
MSVRTARILDVRICWSVLLAFCLLSLIPASARASLVESRLSSGETLSQRNAELSKVRQTLETEVVAQRLADFGLSQEEVAAKLPTLSDDQLHQLAGLSDSLAEGGVLGTVIAVLLIVLLVVVILKVANKEIIIR